MTATMTTPAHSLSTVNRLAELPYMGVPDESAFLTTRHIADRRKWDALIREIGQMRRLGDNWDGAGGMGPSGPTVDWAIRMAQSFRDRTAPPPSRVMPGVTGSVLLEWQSDGHLVQFEIPRPYAIELFDASQGQPPTYEEFEFPQPRSDVSFMNYPNRPEQYSIPSTLATYWYL